MHSRLIAKRACLIVLLAAAISVFSIRGVHRANTRSSDFEMIYAGSLAWRMGGNVYAPDQLLERFRAHGGDPYFQRGERFEALYPPSTYAFLSPLSFLEWSAAKTLWIAINVALTALLMWLLLILVDWRTRADVGWICILVLFFAPVEGGISLGQLSLLCTTLMVAGIVLLRRRHDILAGVLLGLAAAIKPQLGAVLVLLLPIVGAWRGFFAACAAGVALLGLGAIRLNATGIPWFHPMLDAIHRCSPNGQFGGGRFNGTWYNVISLETIVSRFVSNAAITTAISLVFTVGVLLAIWMAYRRANDGQRTRSFDLTICALLALTLLLMYHRFYDCVVLLVPVVIAVDRIRELRQMTAAFVLIGIGLLVFYLPNSAALANGLGDLCGPAIKSSVIFQATIMTHQIWAILSVLSGLLLWLSSDRRRQTVSSPSFEDS